MTALSKMSHKWGYVVLSLAITLLLIGIAVWLPNFGLISSFWFDSGIHPKETIRLLFNLLGGISTNFTGLSASYTIVISLLVGINGTLAVYLLRQQKRRLMKGTLATGIVGIISGMIGLGCAVCGTLFVTPLLMAIGGTVLVATLPLHGAEFGLLGALLLSASTYILFKQITKPAVCKIN